VTFYNYTESVGVTTALIVMRALQRRAFSIHRAISRSPIKHFVDEGSQLQNPPAHELPSWLKADRPSHRWLLSEDIPPWFSDEFGPPKWMVKKGFKPPEWLRYHDEHTAMVLRSYGEDGPPEWLLKMEHIPYWFETVDILPTWFIAFRDQRPPDWALGEHLPSWLKEGKIPAWMYDESVVSGLDEPEWFREVSTTHEEVK
jgi:hypothetical protein